MVLALSDEEFQGIVAAVTSNFAEQPAGPALHLHMRSMRHFVLQQQLLQASHALPARIPADKEPKPAPPPTLSPAASMRPGAAHTRGPEANFALGPRELLQQLGDTCKVTVSVRVHRAALHLFTHQHKAAIKEAAPLVCGHSVWSWRGVVMVCGRSRVRCRAPFTCLHRLACCGILALWVGSSPALVCKPALPLWLLQAAWEVALDWGLVGACGRDVQSGKETVC